MESPHFSPQRRTSEVKARLSARPIGIHQRREKPHFFDRRRPGAQICTALFDGPMNFPLYSEALKTENIRKKFWYQYVFSFEESLDGPRHERRARRPFQYQFPTSKARQASDVKIRRWIPPGIEQGGGRFKSTLRADRWPLHVSIWRAANTLMLHAHPRLMTVAPLPIR